MVKINDADGNKTAFESFDKASLKFTTAKRHALYRVGKYVTSKIKEKIKNPPKTGAYYKYKGRKKQASAPGEPPANRSGFLRRSVGFVVESQNRMVVGAEAPYGVWLDKGTRRMKPRPFVSSTALGESKEVLVIMRKTLDEEMKRGTK